MRIWYRNGSLETSVVKFRTGRVRVGIEYNVVETD